MFVVKLAVPVKGKISSAMSKFVCLQENKPGDPLSVGAIVHYLLL